MAALITTRPLVVDDIDAVLSLMRRSLGESELLRRTPQLFRWKHLDNPFGESIALVAESAGQIVGLRTFMRWELTSREGKRLRCIRAVDTATDPGFQRKGIFRRLTEEAVEIARDEGVDLIFNTPNGKSGPGYLKMGWKEIGPIGAMVRPSLRAIRRTGRAPLRTTIEDYIRGAEPFERITLGARDPRGYRTPRTDAYLTWRFGQHPTARYFVVSGPGSAAVVRPNLRNGRTELVVADILGNPRAGFRNVVAGSRADYVATWFSKGSPERTAAVRTGIVAVPGFTALTLVMRPLGNVPDDLGDIEAWDVAVSDFELL